MFRLFYGAAQANAVETVKNLMVRVPAHLVFMVDKTCMNVFSRHKFRQQGMRILQHDGPQALQLALLFPENIDLITSFQAGADIAQQQFKILIENRLGRNLEFQRRSILPLQRNIQIYVPV